MTDNTLTKTEFILRNSTPEDAEALFAHITRCETDDLGKPMMEWEELTNDLATTPPANKWVMLTPDNQIIGSNILFEWAPGDFAAYVYVHRDYEQYGVADTLIQAAEQRAREVMPTKGEAYLRMYNAIGNPFAEAYFTANGFHVKTHIIVMEMTFTDGNPPPTPDWPTDLTCRLINSPAEDRRVWELIEEAYKVPGRARRPFDSWRSRVFDPEPFDISLFYVVTNLAGEIVAALHNQNLEDATDVSQIAVRPDYRRRGIALNLLYELFSEVYRRGGRRITLGVDDQNVTNGRRLYEQAGATPASHFVKWEKVLRAR